MIVALIVLVISFVIGTAVLSAAMLLIGNEVLNRDTVLKCAGIVLATSLCGLVPGIGVFISIAVWLVGVIVVFEKTIGEAILIALACWAISLVVQFGIGVALVGLGLVTTT
ncbi:MAG: hypothetical protein AAF802_09860 [Planctomycetota bacterium]